MPPNVLLVVLDTVRARNTSLHGHANPTTPFLSSFGGRATVYEQARAPAARSLDSHVSILTGLAVEEHGVTRSGDKLAPGHTVFEELADAGYETGVFSENSWLTDVDAGIKDAFDTVEGPRNVPFPEALDPTSFVMEAGQGAYAEFLRACLAHDAPLKSLANGAWVKLASDYPGLLPTSRTSTPASTYVDLLLEWIDDHAGHWAACLNLMDAHHPYEPESEFDHWGGDQLHSLQDNIEDVKWEFNGGQRPWWQRRALEGLYDGTIRQLDAQLERLVDELTARDQFEETLLVITSDHGEGFGEPSRIRPDTRLASHSDGVHEVLLHVPLVVKFPGQTNGKRVPTVATLTGFPGAVRRVLNGDEQPTGAFVPDGSVVASVPGIDVPVQKRARQYCGDLEPFTGFSRAVYETTDQGVKKYVTWTSKHQFRAATIAIPDAQTDYVVESDDGGRVERTFADVEERDIKAAGSGFEELDEAARQHLGDLGYL